MTIYPILEALYFLSMVNNSFCNEYEIDCDSFWLLGDSSVLLYGYYIDYGSLFSDSNYYTYVSN